MRSYCRKTKQVTKQGFFCLWSPHEPQALWTVQRQLFKIKPFRTLTRPRTLWFSTSDDKQISSMTRGHYQPLHFSQEPLSQHLLTYHFPGSLYFLGHNFFSSSPVILRKPRLPRVPSGDTASTWLLSCLSGCQRFKFGTWLHCLHKDDLFYKTCINLLFTSTRHLSLTPQYFTRH